MRTSFSMPLAMKVLLTLKSHEAGLSHETLILRCLKWFKRRQGKVLLSKRGTAFYNKEHCPSKIVVSLPESMHNYLQGIRYTEKISVSYLVYLALEAYLERVVKLLERVQPKSLLVKVTSHRLLRFQNRRLKGFDLIFVEH